MIIKQPVAMKAAFGENPKRVYGSKGTPGTRMAIASILRKALTQAKEYDENLRRLKATRIRSLKGIWERKRCFR